jgi:hypothetical protein
MYAMGTYQVCQMVYLHTKMQIWVSWNGKIWYILGHLEYLLSLGVFCCNLVCILVCCPMKYLDTLGRTYVFTSHDYRIGSCLEILFRGSLSDVVL